ncbi:MAG: type VI secretion system contractile sheath small subunit [Ketobacteraceae bacterium]|nr:type VI secretion system contractile sheath small subunit [Ketobacteraceae bacterium]
MSKDATVAPKERINVRYRSEKGGANESVELPFKMMVLGDFTNAEDERTIEERKPVKVDKDNFNDVLRSHKVAVDMAVSNKLSDDENPDPLEISLKFQSIKDFTPENLARQVPELNSLLELREALVALKGPLGNVPAFRKAIESIIADDEQRDKFLSELKIEG